MNRRSRPRDRSRRRVRTWAVLALASFAMTEAHAAEKDTPVLLSANATTLMARVAAAYATDVSGVVAVRSHSDLTIKAPIFGRHIVDDNWFVFFNGNLAASSKKTDPRQPPVRDPYRAAYLDEYSYRIVPCATCAPGTSAIACESKARDTTHAHGTIVIDDASAHVICGSETPYKLPWPTKSGELNATWAESPNGWFPVKVDGAFVGSIGPFVGRASYAQSNTAIERFPTVAAAVASLVQSTGLVAAPSDDVATASPEVSGTNAASGGRR